MSSENSFEKLKKKLELLKNNPQARLKADQRGHDNKNIPFTLSWIEQIIHMFCSVTMWLFKSRENTEGHRQYSLEEERLFQFFAGNPLINSVLENINFAAPPSIKTATDWINYFGIFENSACRQLKHFPLKVFKFAVHKLDMEVINEIVNETLGKCSLSMKFDDPKLWWCGEAIRTGLEKMRMQNQYPDLELLAETFKQARGPHSMLKEADILMHDVLVDYIFNSNDDCLAKRLIENFPQVMRDSCPEDCPKNQLAFLFYEPVASASTTSLISHNKKITPDMFLMLMVFVESGVFNDYPKHTQPSNQFRSPQSKKRFDDYFITPLFDLLENVDFYNIGQFFENNHFMRQLDTSIRNLLEHGNERAHICTTAFLRKLAKHLNQHFKDGNLYRLMRDLTAELIDSDRLELMTIAFEVNYLCEGNLVNFSQQEFRNIDNMLKSEFSSKNCFRAKLWLVKTETAVRPERRHLFDYGIQEPDFGCDDEMDWAVADRMYEFFEIHKFLKNEKTWCSWNWKTLPALLKIMLGYSNVVLECRRRNGAATVYPEHHESSLDLTFFWCLTMIKEFGNLFRRDFERLWKRRTNFRYEPSFEYQFQHNEKVRGWEKKFQKTIREDCIKSLLQRHYQRNTIFQGVLELITKILVVNLDSWTLEEDLVSRARQYISECIRPMFMMNGRCAIRICTALDKNIRLKNIWYNRDDYSYRQELHDAELRVKARGAKALFRAQNFDETTTVLDAIETIKNSRSDGEIVDFDHCVEAVVREQQIYNSYEVIEWLAMKILN